jgi:predicted glycosyltransferase
MRIIVYIGHPAHVHLFKNMIWNLEGDGHEVKITAIDKEIALYLLNAYGFKYDNLGKHSKKLLKKLLGFIARDYRLYQVAKNFKPDVFISHGSMFAAHVAKLFRKPHISLEDTEHSTEQYRLYAPFTDVILTSSCFKRDLGKKQVRYNGYHELAYLHPNYFRPDPSVLDYLGLNEDDKFVILRFVSWGASHDIGQRGFDSETKKELVKEIEKRAQVFITSEKTLTKEFEKYRITIPPEKIHDLLYYATMYIGEGATMASEAAVLGTPAIYVNTLRLGYLDEQEERYGLLYNFSNPKTAQKDVLRKAVEQLEDENLKTRWHNKRAKLLSEKIDVTKFLTDFIENYPESLSWKSV